jgi:hypothetical protein
MEWRNTREPVLGSYRGLETVFLRVCGGAFFAGGRETEGNSRPFRHPGLDSNQALFSLGDRLTG